MAATLLKGPVVPMRCILAVYVLLLTACVAPATPPGGTTRPCAPSEEAPPAMPAVSMPPGVAAPPTPGPFSFRIADPPIAASGENDTAQVDGRPMSFQAGILFITLIAADVEWEGPEGKLPGILAHHALIEPVLRDFDLEVIEQSRIPQRFEPTMNKVDGTVVTPPPVRRWWLKPDFLVRVKNAESESLDTLQADATALGIRGTWVFPHRATAGLFARAYRIQRRKHCYDIRFAGPNVMADPA